MLLTTCYSLLTTCYLLLTFEESLTGLPLYVAGCTRLIVLAGPTYTRRLWCIVELFTWIHINVGTDSVDVLTFGSEAQAHATHTEQFARFDASDAECFLPQEKDTS